MLLTFQRYFVIVFLCLLAGSASAIEISQFPHYEMDVHLIPENQTIKTEGILILPAADESRNVLKLALSEQMQDLRVEILTPQECAGEAILQKKENRPWSRDGWGTITWHFQLRRTVPQGTPLKVKFSYQGESTRSSFIFSLRKDVLFGSGIGTAWYPEVEESDATTRLKGLRATGKLQFHVPPSFVVHSAGKRVSTNQEEQQGIFKFENSSPIFFSFAAAKFIRVAAQGSPEVSGYLLRERENIGEYLSKCSRILKMLTNEFGPSPLSPEFAIVELPSEQSNDAGFAGASLDGFMLATNDFLDQPFNTAYYGHEVSHQWWGGLVRVNGTAGIWMLQEGLAQYGSLRAVEILEGSEKAKQYRSAGYPGYFEFESSGPGYLRLAAAGLDHPLVTLPRDLSISRRLSNSKGMFVWDMLAQEAGRERLNEAFRKISSKYAYKRIRWEDFLQEIQNSAGRDLKTFYQQWFNQAGAPSWQSKWSIKQNSLEIEVRQTAPYFHINVPVVIRGANKHKTVERLQLNGEVSKFSLAIPFPVDSVELDPDFTVLHWTPQLREDAITLAPYTRGYMKLIDGATKEAEEEFRAALNQVSVPDQHGLEFLLRYGLSQALLDQDLLKEALSEIQATVSCETRRIELLPWAYLHLAFVAKKMGNHVLLEQTVEKVNQADKIAGGATGAAEQAQQLLREFKAQLNRKER